MATLIRFKRKKNGDNNANIKLQRGEPYYNLGSKKFYIGNDTGSADVPEKIPDSQKHIAEITDQHSVSKTESVNSGDSTISFTVGEATDNKYTKVVNNVDVAKGIILDSMYFGTEADRNKLKDRMKVTSIPKGTVFFQEAE